MSDATFTKPNPGIIQSSTGFEVRHVSRNGMEYREGDDTLPVEVEGGFDRHGNHVLNIYLSSIRWKPPFDLSRREEILMNIAQAELFDGTFPEFHGWIFSKPEPSVVKSENGFLVKRTATDTLEYVEGTRVIRMRVEEAPSRSRAFGKVTRIYVDTMEGHIPADRAQQHQIASRIFSALLFDGRWAEFVRSDRPKSSVSID